VPEILDALRDAAAANPEKAQELVADLKAKFDSLSPEEQQEAIAKLKEVAEKAQNMPPEKKEEIAALIREKAGV
jgi:hypothetical protein